MFEKRYTKQQIIDCLVNAKSMYLRMADEMSEEVDQYGNKVFDDKAVEKMEAFAVAVGDVAFEIKCGNILKD